MNFSINNKSTEDYKIFVKTSNPFEMFEKRREIVEILGRTGDLIIEDGSYKNKTLTIEAYTDDEVDIEMKLKEIEQWLTTTDYTVLTFESGSNLEVYFLSITEVKEIVKNAVEFKINFTCRKKI